MNRAIEILELKLSDADIAAIHLRHQRRREKQNVGGCGFVDIGDISSADSSDLSQACKEAEQKLVGAA